MKSAQVESVQVKRGQTRGCGVRSVGLAFLVAVGAAATASAQNQPIQSPQDAACRDEACNRLVGTPNPKNLSLYDLGAGLYHACMRRAGGEITGTRARLRSAS